MRRPRLRPRIEWQILLPGGLMLLFGAVDARAQTASERHPADLMDMNSLQHQHGDAKRLLLEGEAAFSRGEAQRALQAFKRAREQAPGNALIDRRLCQARTELGWRRDAIDSCLDAVKERPSSVSNRATVGALMSGPPTMDDLALALLFAQQIKKARPEQPWGYAADCDVALRLGDRTMLRKCVQDLDRVAPGHYETLRARRLAARSPTWAWVFWCGLALVSTLSLAHAVWRARRRVFARLWRPSSAIVIAMLGASRAIPAQAQTGASPHSAKPAPAAAAMEDAPPKPAGSLSKFRIDPANPSASLPSVEERDKSPLQFGYLLMDLLDLADAATKKGDHAQAAKYHAATVKAVPDAAVGYRNTCASYEKAGNPELAVGYCRGALAVKGAAVDDYLRFSRLALASATPLTKEQVNDLSNVVLHLRSETGAEAAAAHIECEVGTRLEDEGMLTTCTSVLARLAPDDPKTISFQWALALKRGELDEADKLVERAKRTPMRAEGVQTMERTLLLERSFPRQVERHWRSIAWAGAALLGLGVLGFAGRFVLRRRTKLAGADPAPEGDLKAT